MSVVQRIQDKLGGLWKYNRTFRRWEEQNGSVASFRVVKKMDGGYWLGRKEGRAMMAMSEIELGGGQ